MGEAQRRHYQKQKEVREALKRLQQEDPSKYDELMRRVQKNLEREERMKCQPFSEITDGYFLARRSWGVVVTPEGIRLSSFQSTLWTPFEALEAICHSRTIHTPPNYNCGCGIYGAKADEYVHKQSIVGTIALWGRYIEGEYGFQAQFGYPREFTHVVCSGCRAIKDVKGSKAYIHPSPPGSKVGPSEVVKFGCEVCTDYTTALSHLRVPASYVFDLLHETYGLIPETSESIESFIESLDLGEV